MTLEQFVEKWLGKEADYDGQYQGQCVDLFRFYVKEVLELSQPSGVSGARDFWANFDRDAVLKDNFQKIYNTLTAVPQKGDVIIWDSWTGNPYGHVAIFLEGNVMSFTSLDQNYPTLSKVTKTSHNYLRPKVLGWLRPIKMSDSSDCIEEFNPNADIPGEIEEKFSPNLKDYEWYNNHWSWEQVVDFADDRYKDVQDLNEANQVLQLKVGQCEIEVKEFEDELGKCRTRVLALEKERGQLSAEIVEKEKTIQTIKQENNALKKENKKLSDLLYECQNIEGLCGYSWKDRFLSLFACIGGGEEDG